MPPANAREALDEFEGDLNQLLQLVAEHVQIRRRILENGKIVTFEPPNDRAMRIRDDLFLWYSFELTLQRQDDDESYSTTDTK